MSSETLRKTFEPFTYKSLEDLRRKTEALQVSIPISTDLEILRQKIVIKNRTVPNRLAIQPMEGFDAILDGSPSDLTLRRYLRYANGGAGLIWFEATAISDECRSNDHQLMLTEKNLTKFNQLVASVRKTSHETLKELGIGGESLLILQLNHSGRYSKLKGKPFPIRAYNNLELDAKINVSKEDGTLITDKELENIEDIWVEKALLAKKAGFDGVDIKSCHGYLISELLNARTRKDSNYGGLPLENRSRLLLNIFKKLLKKLNNSDFLLTSRMGVYDGLAYPNGFGIEKESSTQIPPKVDLSEPLELLNKIYDLGVRLINVSMGIPRYNPHITRPFEVPLKGGTLPMEHPLYGVYRHIHLTSIIKQQLPKDIIIVGSGYSYLRSFSGPVLAGGIKQNMVDIGGFGRLAFANPDFPKQIFQNGSIDKSKVCIACSKCSELMRMGVNTGCVVRDPQYKKSIKN